MRCFPKRPFRGLEDIFSFQLIELGLSCNEVGDQPI